ncbi:PD40 domain-containing protein [candidate division WOR-3 bacterium]|nr:PD40 domain-containing protein [candidate division WOR-3 bacterium]
MKMSRFVIWGGVVIAGALLLSCNTIQGDLELLVDEPTSAHSPAWSSDGSMIYYILGSDPEVDLPEPKGYLYSLDVETKEIQQLSTEEIWGFETSPYNDYALTSEGPWFWIWDIEDWEKVDSCQPCQEAIENWSNIIQLKFSYESSRIVYYSYWIEDSLFLRRINLEDSTDELVMTKKEWKHIMAPGPGDTLLALIDTIYNLNSDDKIYVEHEPQYLHWNPADPQQLLISSGKQDKDLFMYDLRDKKLKRINSSPFRISSSDEAKFSPDGTKIVFKCVPKSEGSTQIWLFNLTN